MHCVSETGFVIVEGVNCGIVPSQSKEVHALPY